MNTDISNTLAKKISFFNKVKIFVKIYLMHLE